MMAVKQFENCKVGKQAKVLDHEFYDYIGQIGIIESQRLMEVDDDESVLMYTLLMPDETDLHVCWDDVVVFDDENEIIPQNEKHDIFVNRLKIKMKDHYDIMDYHIHTYNNFNYFFDQFYTGEIEKDVQTYLMHKKRENMICKEDYLATVKEDIKKALEALFQEPLSEEKLKLIDEYQIDLDKLYNLAKEHIERTFVNLVKNIDLLQNRDNYRDNDYLFLLETVE